MNPNPKKRRPTAHSRNEFIRLAKAVHTNERGVAMYCYERVKYRGSKTPVEIRCPRCSAHAPKGERVYFWKKPNTHLGSKNRKGQGCPICSASTMERAIYFILRGLGVVPEFQKMFEDLVNPETGRHLRFDFFIPETKTIIEYNGVFHTDDKGFATATPVQAQRFGVKEAYARERGFDFLVIDYTQKAEIVDIISDAILDTTIKNNHAALRIPKRG